MFNFFHNLLISLKNIGHRILNPHTPIPYPLVGHTFQTHLTPMAIWLVTADRIQRIHCYVKLQLSRKCLISSHSLCSNQN